MGVVPVEPVVDHAVGDVVGHELAGVHVPLGLDAERGLVLQVRAEHVPRGDVGDAVPLRDATGLGALPGTGGSEHDDAHVLAPLVVDAAAGYAAT